MIEKNKNSILGIVRVQQKICFLENSQEKFHTLRETCLNEKGHTIRAVEKFADAEVADFSNDFIHRDEITKELSEYMKAHFASIKELVFSQDGNERYHELEKIFSFMYR